MCRPLVRLTLIKLMLLLLISPPDAWGTIAKEVIIPWVKNMHLHMVPTSFVDKLLWLPSESGPQFIRCSDIQVTDSVFGAVKKK